MDQQHFCDERSCMEMATEEGAPTAFGRIRLCSRHANMLRAGASVEMTQDYDRGGPQRWQIILER